MCQTTLLVHREKLYLGNNNEREGLIRRKDALSLFGPLFESHFFCTVEHWNVCRKIYMNFK